MPPPPYLEQGCGGPLALTTQEVMQACQGVGEVRGGHQQHGKKGKSQESPQPQQQAQVEEAQANAQSVQVKIDEASLVSPISGVITVGALRLQPNTTL